MNVFDFDKTLYAGDSTVDFYMYCVSRHPSVLRALPKQVPAAIRYLSGTLDKTRFKERFYGFLRYLEDGETVVSEFWERNIGKMNPEVLEHAKPGDIVISASPEFLLKIPCEKYGFELIASRVDIETGKTEGENCYGEEKPRRFKLQFPDARIEEFYSDSTSDQPMADLAAKSFLIKQGKVCDWSDAGEGK